jgi:hypothetical protein
MPWLCFLFASSAVQTAKPLRFDIAALAAQRDSYVFYLNGEERGQAVWQYEIQGDRLVFTATSELRPADAESLRVVLDRRSGAPVSSFHRIALFNPRSDTVLVEHDLIVRQGRVEGTRRAVLRDGRVTTRAVRTPLPAGVVWSDYGLLAAPVAIAAPGDSLKGSAYSEFGDSLVSQVLVAEPPATITVPAGTFETLPLRSAELRVYVSRGTGSAPRRVVKGESLDGVFRFELVQP